MASTVVCMVQMDGIDRVKRQIKYIVHEVGRVWDIIFLSLSVVGPSLGRPL